MDEWWLKYHAETHKQTQASLVANHVFVCFFFFLWWKHIFRITKVAEELEEVDGIIAVVGVVVVVVVVVENNIFFVVKVRRCKGQNLFSLL